MRKGNILPIAVMAFALVGFLFVLDYSINGHGKWPWSTKNEVNENVNTTTTINPVVVNRTTNSVVRNANTSIANTNSVVTSNTNTVVANTNTSVDVTANWKTYTDTTYGYTYKYPSNWNLQVARANDPSNNFGTEYSYVVDPANADILFEVCPTGEGCVVTQDAEYKSTTSNITVDQHLAVQSDWVVSSVANCSSCTPATTIKITSQSGWSGARNFLLRTGNKASTVPGTILSTFTFTK